MKMGTIIQLGDGELTLYPLTLAQLQELDTDLEKVMTNSKQAMFSKGGIAAFVRVFTASARRGDTSITAEKIADMIDMEDLPAALNALFGLSGFKKSEVVNGSGITHPTSGPNGAASTPALSQQPDGTGLQ